MLTRQPLRLEPGLPGFLSRWHQIQPTSDLIFRSRRTLSEPVFKPSLEYSKMDSRCGYMSGMDELWMRE